MDFCKNCKQPVSGNYCSNCGQPTILKRINKQYLASEITDVFCARKGFFHTVKGMIVRPGNTVRNYMTENRSRYVKPITFVIITSLIYTIFCHLFQIGLDSYGGQDADTLNGSAMGTILIWMIENQGYTSLLSGFFMAFWVKLFFRKTGYNLFEIFVLICFVSGIGTLFTALMLVFKPLTQWNLIYIANVISIVYSTWAIGQFFDPKKASSYIKAFISYMLSIAIQTILIVMVGLSIDIIILLFKSIKKLQIITSFFMG